MSRRNVTNEKLNGLIQAVVSEITIAKKVSPEEAHEAVRQLILLAGDAFLATTETPDATATLVTGFYKYTFRTEFTGKMEKDSYRIVDYPYG